MTSISFPPRGGEPGLVFEDPEVLVLDKPAGMHTAPADSGPDVPAAVCLADWVYERWPEAGLVIGRGRGEGGLLHRLDRETSGLVLFARTEEAFRSLEAAARAGSFRKEYALRALPSAAGMPGSRPERAAPAGLSASAWKLLCGGPEPGAIPDAKDGAPAIEAFRNLLDAAREEGRPVFVESLFRPYGPGAARVACAAPGADLGKSRDAWGSALYRTEILAAGPGDGALDLRVALTRGFRHQVRAHLAWIGLPLLGDELYGGGAGERLALHASALEFPHPRTGARVRMEG